MRTIVVIALLATEMPAAVAQLEAQKERRVGMEQARNAIPVTIHAPEAESFEVVLDEIELRWSESQTRPNSVNVPDGASVDRMADGEAIMAIRDTGTLAELNALALALEQQNPGAVASLVLHEPGRPRSEATRRLLGREVAVVFDEVANPDEILKTLSGVRIQPVPSVARAYVVEAADPLGALALAEQLRGNAGVRAAYPLLRRRQFTR